VSRVTLDQLRVAVRRTLRSYGIVAGFELVDELVSIADHHAAEESAAAVSEQAADLASRRDAARPDRAART
jgi:hypothetical protein